jgi:hypothetical protein
VNNLMTKNEKYGLAREAVEPASGIGEESGIEFCLKHLFSLQKFYVLKLSLREERKPQAKKLEWLEAHKPAA